MLRQQHHPLRGQSNAKGRSPALGQPNPIGLVPMSGSNLICTVKVALETGILALLNRGVMITPFHNMMLVCPDTTDADVDQLLAAFDEVLGLLAA